MGNWFLALLVALPSALVLLGVALGHYFLR